VASRATRCVLVLVVMACVAACAPSRYSMKHDKAPEGDFDFSQVPDAQPKWEPLSRGGNRTPYKVNGKWYKVLPTAEGYVEEGVASWYGLKFHGELTSNGETYNMYEMSAAHKSLPLPSYVRVTNLENGVSVVVRVNDRGPFHNERLIDMSFAAANRLGFADKGTARVKLEAITLPKTPAPAEAQAVSPAEQTSGVVPKVDTPAQDRLAPFVQVAAYTTQSAADALAQRIRQQFGMKAVFVARSQVNGREIFRVRIGPYDLAERALADRIKLEQNGVGEPIVITRSVLAKQQ